MQIVSIESIREKAREAFHAGLLRDEHGMNWHAPALADWLAEYDRLSMAGRAPCVGIVPRDFAAHLVALTAQHAGIDAHHAMNEREHIAAGQSVRNVVGAALAQEAE